jgi:hypothetical protein
MKRKVTFLDIVNLFHYHLIMTTLHRSRNWKITMYANDHDPPHFHVRIPDGGAILDLESLAVLAGTLPRSTLQLVRTWAAENKPLLADSWEALHQEDKL